MHRHTCVYMCTHNEVVSCKALVLCRPCSEADVTKGPLARTDLVIVSVRRAAYRVRVEVKVLVGVVQEATSWTTSPVVTRSSTTVANGTRCGIHVLSGRKGILAGLQVVDCTAAAGAGVRSIGTVLVIACGALHIESSGSGVGIGGRPASVDTVMLVNNVDAHRPAVNALVSTPMICSRRVCSARTGTACVDHGRSRRCRTERSAFLVQIGLSTTTGKPHLPCARRAERVDVRIAELVCGA